MPPIFKQTTYAAKHKCERKCTQKSTILRKVLNLILYNLRFLDKCLVCMTMSFHKKRQKNDQTVKGNILRI